MKLTIDGKRAWLLTQTQTIKSTQHKNMAFIVIYNYMFQQQQQQKLKTEKILTT